MNEQQGRDDRYYALFEELYSLIIQAHVDIFMLNELDCINDFARHRIFPAAFESLKHICALIQKDLCLTVWKLSSDRSKNATTLYRFQNYLREDCGLNKRIALSKNTKKFLKELSAYRNLRLAHNDTERFNSVITLNTCKSALAEMLNMFNDLIIESIDDRVCPITAQEVLNYQVSTGLGFGYLLRNGINLKLDNPAKEDSDNA